MKYSYLENLLIQCAELCVFVIARDSLAVWLFQLWTVYLEQLGGADGATSESPVLEFWGKVTPGILQLLSLSKSVSLSRYSLSFSCIIISFSMHYMSILNLYMKLKLACFSYIEKGFV